MNRIVTLSAFALLGAAASFGASAPQGSRSARAEIEASSWLKTVEKASMENLKDQRKAPSTATRADGWKSLGTGIYRECLLSCLFSNCPAQDIEVEIEESETEPGVYRLINPYASWENPFSDVSYDITGDYNMVIHTQNVGGTDYIWIEDFNSGIYIDGLGDMTLITQVGQMAAQYGVEAILEQFENGFGINNAGTMTYPMTMTSKSDGKSYYNFLIGLSMEEGYYPGNTNKVPFVVTLPGVEPPKPYNPFDGYVFLGKGLFLNNMMNPFLGEAQAEPYEVNIYDEIEGAHYLHIQGAWGEYSDEEHKNQDFILNAQDPRNVLVPYQDTGYNDFEFGQIAVMGFGYYYAVQEGLPYEEIEAQYKDNLIYVDEANKRIVFSPNSMLFSFSNSDNPNALYESNANYQYEGYLELPDEYFAAVKDVIAVDENAPVKYFNLQGVEIAQPAKGQLVIKKQGSKSVKMIAE